jgi:hypothetical protein
VRLPTRPQTGAARAADRRIAVVRVELLRTVVAGGGRGGWGVADAAGGMVYVKCVRDAGYRGLSRVFVEDVVDSPRRV